MCMCMCMCMCMYVAQLCYRVTVSRYEDEGFVVRYEELVGGWGTLITLIFLRKTDGPYRYVRLRSELEMQQQL